MKVFILGGTGFIGYHATTEFLKNGHEVSTISLDDIKIGDWFPKNVSIHYGNIYKMEKKELVDLFTGYDAIVYALGPDDRVTPDIDAYTFFHDRLVVACNKVVQTAKTAKVKKCVILNSYFAYFHRTKPERNLSLHHPYIKCRIEQAESSIKIGGDSMDVMILELPYIFGIMPERIPLWNDVLVKMLYKNRIIFFPKGGTNMISVEHVAEAIVGAVERGIHGRKYTIGDVNMCWVKMLKLMLKSIDMKHKTIISLPSFLMKFIGKRMHKKNLRKGKHSGLDLRYLFEDILCRTYYFDSSETIKELGYGTGGIEQSIDLTIKKCLSSIEIENRLN